MLWACHLSVLSADIITGDWIQCPKRQGLDYSAESVMDASFSHADLLFAAAAWAKGQRSGQARSRSGSSPKKADVGCFCVLWYLTGPEVITIYLLTLRKILWNQKTYLIFWTRRYGVTGWSPPQSWHVWTTFTFTGWKVNTNISLMHKILGVDASKYHSKHLTNPTSAPTLTLQQIL